jgi:hypothetical protein
VPVEALHEHGVIGRDGVDELARGQGLRRPGLVVPVPFLDPGALGQRARVGADARGEVLLVAGVAEVHGEETEAAAEEVHVRVVETGHDQAAAQFHHSRGGPDPRLHVGVAAHGGDAAVLHRDRRGVGPALPRPHASAAQDEIGGGLRRRQVTGHESRRQPQP